MNDFFYIMIGLMIMLAGMVTGILVNFNILPPMIYIIISMALTVVAGITILLISILMRGILAPMISARMGGKTMVQVLTANKNIDLLSGRETDGIVDTRRGSFIVPTDTVYSWPNGVRAGIGFYKYGVTLNPMHIKAASVLKKNNIRDIDELEQVQAEAEKNGAEIKINLNEEI